MARSRVCAGRAASAVPPCPQALLGQSPDSRNAGALAVDKFVLAHLLISDPRPPGDVRKNRGLKLRARRRRRIYDKCCAGSVECGTRPNKWCKRGRKSAASLAFLPKPPAGGLVLLVWNRRARRSPRREPHLPQREGRGRPLAACTGILQSVPWGADAREAARRPQGRPAQILRPIYLPRRAQGFRGLSGAAAQAQVVRLLKAPVFGGPNAVLAYLSR